MLLQEFLVTWMIVSEVRCKRKEVESEPRGKTEEPVVRKIHHSAVSSLKRMGR